MSDDERALKAKLAALDAEVRAETARKVAAQNQREAELRAKREDLAARNAELVARTTALTKRGSSGRAPVDDDAPSSPSGSDLEDMVALATRAKGVKDELTRPKKRGDKSWLTSGGLSLVFGPLGWLYAGSLREAIPASLLYLLLAYGASSLLPTMLLMPVLLVLLPASAIVGAVYAMSYNREGKRARLLGKGKQKLLGR